LKKFGERKQKSIEKKTHCLQTEKINNETKKKVKIPSGILNIISELDEKRIIDEIKIKRHLNEQKQDRNYNKAIGLTNEGKFETAIKISSEDDLGFYNYYQLAQKNEKRGKIIKAAEIYWFNIFHNGTDAPGNFNRLLILLRKMKDFEKEYKIARIYKSFVNESQFEKIDKRIETIKKKIVYANKSLR